MRALYLLATLATLAACGADGPPSAPGLSVSGDARVGVAVTN
ncbi:hypothetical protein [Pseudorhodobacter ferrugineus]|nr:hypothetical protein [Pseudorhodobacter ferrugineus]